MIRNRKAFLAAALCVGAWALAAAAPAGAVTGFTAGAGSPHPITGTPNSLATGDINSDSVPDLVVSGNVSGTVSVLLGDGTGGFIEPVGSPYTVEAGFNPAAVAIGRMNTGPDPDVVVALNGPGSATLLKVMIGNGNGAFTMPSAAVNFGEQCPIDLALGQLSPESDSNLDVAVTAVCDNSLLVAYGDGNGGFSGADANATGGVQPTGVAVGDLGGGTEAEIAVAHHSSDDVAVFERNTGLNVFQPIAGSPFGTDAVSLRGLTFANLNLDSDPDIAVASEGSDGVSILAGTGFGPIAGSPFNTGPGDNRPWSVAAGQFDGGSSVDLVTANENGNNATVLLNNGLGALTPLSSGPINLGPGLQDAQDVVAEDFDGDGHTDFATANGNGSRVSVMLNQFRPPVAPSVTDTDPDSPSNGTSIKVKGSAEGNGIVTVYSGASCNSPLNTGGTAIFNSTGIQVSVPANTATTLSADVIDGEGGSPCSTVNATYVEDSAAPAPPTLSSTTPGSPSNDETPTVVGSAETGSTVKLYATPGCTGSPIAMGTAGQLANGFIQAAVTENDVTELRATATDAASNTSSCSAPLSYVEDSIPPDEPTVLDTVPASPSPNGSPQVRGTAPPGSTVKIYGAGGCGGVELASGTPAQFAAGIPVSVPADMTTTLRATATDTAGNASACSPTSVAYEEDSTAPPAPVPTGTSPGSPANQNQPGVRGTAQPGSIVRLFLDAACTGPALTTGSAASFASPGLPVLVADDSTTTFFATSTDQAGNASGCSPGSTTFVEDSRPPDTLVSALGRRPTDRTAAFTLAGDETPVAFECRVDGGSYGRCLSPHRTGRLGVGGHVFEARAVDIAGNADPSPSRRTFKVKKRKRR